MVPVFYFLSEIPCPRRTWSCATSAGSERTGPRCGLGLGGDPHLDHGSQAMAASMWTVPPTERSTSFPSVRERIKHGSDPSIIIRLRRLKIPMQTSN